MKARADARSAWKRLIWGPALAAALCLAVEGAPPLRISFDQAPVAVQGPNIATFAPVVKRVAPSVVNIHTVKKLRLDNQPSRMRASSWKPSEILKDFSDETPTEGMVETEERVSSGVIISEEGYIITNFHVVDNAEQIRVSLSDGAEYVPEIVGRDPSTDLALLKISAPGLKPVVFADSDQLQVGDVALTLGNPYGIGQTVSMGIVSATGRGGFGILDYEDFIQTDASINPGNSGGALVDAQGRLVGINTAIMSISGSNQGIGFAVPANLARHVAIQLAKQGKVTRSYLGMFFLPLSPELVKALDLPSSRGVLVAGVSPKSPAARAGLKSGDILLAINGAPAVDCRKLQTYLAHLPLDQELQLQVFTKGQNRQFAFKPSVEPPNPELTSGPPAARSDVASALKRLLK